MNLACHKSLSLNFNRWKLGNFNRRCYILYLKMVEQMFSWQS